MDIEIIGGDEYGNEAYAKLFDDIMSDLNKAVLIDKVQLTLEPATPLFIFSIVLRAAPSAKTIGDVATVRTDVGGVHVTITQERYAPDILKELWAKYGSLPADQVRPGRPGRQGLRCGVHSRGVRGGRQARDHGRSVEDDARGHQEQEDPDQRQRHHRGRHRGDPPSGDDRAREAGPRGNGRFRRCLRF